MTTIAFDGQYLAADKRSTLCGTRSRVTKIRRGKDGTLVGVAGTSALAEDIFAWLLDGAERPPEQSENGFCSVIEITPEGRIFKHERVGRYEIEDGFFAIGSGAAFALASMACGRSAIEAVEVATMFDTATGDGINAYELGNPRFKYSSTPRRKKV